MIWRRAKAEETDEEQKPWPLRLFVTAANTNTVYRVGVSESKDMRRARDDQRCDAATPALGMTPSALAMNSDQSALYVVCSDANAIAVVDISDSKSVVAGLRPDRLVSDGCANARR